MTTRKLPPTADRLRHEIDAGRTGDKIAHPDPAAAPLGTDEEAAGTPLTPDRVRMALEHEVRSRPPKRRIEWAISLFAGCLLFLILIAVATSCLLHRAVLEQL
jgi:hypothetical protein